MNAVLEMHVAQDDDETRLARNEARAGSSNHVTRYVLPISLILVVVAFGGLLLIWR
jgi:hypothetical protein